MALIPPWLGLFFVLLVLERVAPGRRGERIDWAGNGWAWLAGIVAGLSSTPLAGGAATLLVNRLGGGLIRLPDEGWGLLAGLAAYLLAMDLGEYLFHRAQHAFPAMWAMHSLHHSDPAINVTTTSRHFWLEAAIKSLTIWLAVGLMFRASPKIVALYGLATLYNQVLHANLKVGLGRLGFLVNTPQYHRRHHSSDPAHFNSNYAALLTIWDVIAGSYRPPSAGEFPPTGLSERAAPAGVYEVIAWPFARRTPALAGDRSLLTAPSP
jgi:sterol desaturase/sphingolipid hydroxylase (fatty acid hydroxylase superfamily)